jgi:hypothetical protein
MLKRKEILESLLSKRRATEAELHVLNEQIQALQPLSAFDYDPVERCLSALLVKPLIQLCQMYIERSLCIHCNLYHHRELCVKYSLSYTRTENIFVSFTSKLLTCLPLGKFEDENDTVSFQQFIASLLADFPQRRYANEYHDRADCSSNSNVSICILPIKMSRFPPKMKLCFEKSTSPNCHMSLYTVPKKDSSVKKLKTAVATTE